MRSRMQIEWCCRRGVRELDLLLQTYLREEFDRASLAEKAAFLQLLDAPDTQLLKYLFGRIGPDQASLAEVVSKIRGPFISRA